MNTNESKIPKIPYASGVNRRVRTRLLASLKTAEAPYVKVEAKSSPLIRCLMYLSDICVLLGK